VNAPPSEYQQNTMALHGIHQKYQASQITSKSSHTFHALRCALPTTKSNTQHVALLRHHVIKQGVALTGCNTTGPLHAGPWWVTLHMCRVTDDRWWQTPATITSLPSSNVCRRASNKQLNLCLAISSRASGLSWCHLSRSESRVARGARPERLCVDDADVRAAVTLEPFGTLLLTVQTTTSNWEFTATVTVIVLLQEI